MEVQGHVENGVVVFDGGASLPEGVRVVVSLANPAQPAPQSDKRRVELPLVKSGVPGSIQITNQQIYEFLDAEDTEAVKRSWDAPS